MLVEFTVGNYLSFKERKTLSLVATSIKEHKDTNIIHSERMNLLKGAVVYGANASGKSNLIKAMSNMRRLVLKSVELSSASELKVTPFLLNTDTEEAPSSFEVVFMIGEIRYRYGFEATNSAIISEWLFEQRKNSEKPLFVRDKDGIEIWPGYPEGQGLEEKTRDNALFLSVVDQFNGALARRIMQWFNNFTAISGLSHEQYKMVTFKMLEEPEIKPLLQDFFNNLDLGFDDIEVTKELFNPDLLPKEMPEDLVRQLGTDLVGKTMLNFRTSHRKFNEKNEPSGTVTFDLRSQESAGSNKVFNISGPVFDTLTNGGVLMIDELDSSLHPLLTLAITRLFNSNESNPKNAQLIFATHDTNLLRMGKYRRDQIFFVEKDKYGASDLYSLVEYKEGSKTIRNDRSYEKDYIQGRYGAIPFVGNLNSISDKWLEK
jgi:AAA15 family ATPase/GTPase